MRIKGGVPKQPVFIPLLLGTTREGRLSECAAKFVLEVISKRNDLTAEFFDVRDFDFGGSEGRSMKNKNPQWRDAMLRADGLLIVTPEYNRGYPGSLKMALDMLLDEYDHKAVGLMGVSDGPMGGARVIEGLLPVMRIFGLAVSGYTVYFSNADTLFATGAMTAGEVERYTKSVNRLLDDVVFLARSLRWGREQLQST
ncbi:MAG: hypothetical protein UY09_C0011G0004 [Parcubacteria group bacterium GW2011_GWA2_47_8]|nr:MAG: hypothetical protein UY09_C0011G0004 [Parcubacteria group bacterium GW2011_GWA2_47_8]OHB19318.1 MAG: hypothetical protein A2666_00715 [Parcubacteria group bacterium RIFCSPHIGHO2_01_FULL_47_10b]